MRGIRIVFPQAGRVAVEEFDVPTVRPTEVLIRTEVSLVSAGTELTTLLNARGTSTFPVYPGYSNVGIVEEVGAAVTEHAPGERVVTLGRHASHVAVDLAPGGPGGPGYLQTVPSGITSDDASFTILGSVAMHGVRKAEPKLHQSAAVIGQGVVGQLVAQLLRVSGCRPVIGIDTFPMRLEKARQSGVSVVVNADSGDVAAAVKRITNGVGVDLGFDATRNPATLPLLMDMAAQSGKVIIVGSIPGSIEIPLFDPLCSKELTIIGIHQPKAPLIAHPYLPWTQSRNRVAFLDYLRDGSVRVDHLLTHRAAPADAPRVYDMIRAGGADWLGVAFVW